MAVLVAGVLTGSGIGAPGQSDVASFEGEWSLHFKGVEIEVGHWVYTDKFGKKFGGREIRGPYRISKQPNGHVLFIYHQTAPWMVLFPQAGHFDGRRFDSGLDLGPDWGTDLTQFRVRPGGNELEIWKNIKETEVEFAFTDYTLVRRGAKSYSGAPKDVSL